MTEPTDAETTITVYPNGPLIVRGDFQVVTASGEALTHERKAVALCRCGNSALKPFCDGSHKITGFRAAE